MSQSRLKGCLKHAPAMHTIHLNIAHLRVRIHTTPVCREGVEALTALYTHGKTGNNADLCFTFTPLGDGTSLDCNGEHIWTGQEAGEVVAAFEWAFYNRVIAALYPYFLSLHAATVSWQGHGLTIAGTSGAGKSSLCTAALLHGASYFSDEYSLLDKQGCITPFPRPLQWDGNEHPAFSRQDMHDSGLFGEGHYAFTGQDGSHITSLLWHPRNMATGAVNLSLLLLPHFDPDSGGVHNEPLARSQALMELAEEMHHKLPVQDRLCELHRRIPDSTRFVRLGFSDVHLAWKHVEQLLAGRCPD